MSFKPKLLLIWHEAGNPIYWDRFRALSEFFDVLVFGLREFQGVRFSLPTTLESFDLRLYDACFSNHWLSFISFKMLADIWRQDANLIYLHEEPHAAMSFAVTCLRRGRPTILDSAVINKRGNIAGLNPFEYYVHHAATGFFCRNNEVIEILVSRGCKREKIIGTIGNGVSEGTFFPSGRERARARLVKHFPHLASLFESTVPVVGFAGRIWRPKGIAIFKELVSSYPCKVLACGSVIDPALAEELRQGGVVLLPKLSADILRDFYSALDFFVLPSIPAPNWREQFGRVLIESIYCGTPALGSKIGAIPTIVGAAASFEAPSVASLTDCIEQYKTPALRHALLDWQTANVRENFSWSVIAKKVNAAYEKLCGMDQVKAGVVIFQNYYTPYRSALFEQLGERWDLTILYIHKPEDEGRHWAPTDSVRFKTVRARYIYLGKMILYQLFGMRHFTPTVKCVILLDDNPSNLAMICQAILLRLRIGVRILLWVEHIQDPTKPLLKKLYQHACSRILLGLSDGALAYSSMTVRYLGNIGVKDNIFRVNQAVPQGSVVHGRKRLAIRKFGYMGSNVPRKNVTVLLEAFQELNFPGVELHVAGFQPKDPHLNQPNVFWHGYVNGVDKDNFLDLIDALVLPSLAEPWGLVVNEALSKSCICLVSDRCGSKEIMLRADSRLVFEPTVSGIQTAMRFCTSLEVSQIDAIAVALRKAYGPYSLENAAEQISAAIDGKPRAIT